MSSKINKELKDLVRNQVISSDISDKISQYYDQKNISNPTKLLLIFGVLGALLIGSGIILMLAHNWDNFSRGIKTIFAFIPLLIGQVFVGFSIVKEKNKTWKEASGTFLLFVVGASIALVSQVYNIVGDLDSFLLTWIVLCLPLIYLLRSQAVTLLILLLSTYYATEVGYWRYADYSAPWIYIILLVTMLPQYWIQLKKNTASNSVSIFNWIWPTSIAIALGAFIAKNEELGFVMYITLFGLFYNIGKLPIFKGIRTLRNGFLVIGSLGTIVLLMTFTFNWPWKTLFTGWTYNSREFYISMVLCILSSMVLGCIIIKKGIKSVNLFQCSFLIFWVLFFLLSDIELVPMILTNILVFILGIAAIKIGSDRFNFGILNYGLLIIAILITCKFFDPKINFAIKGGLFVLAGAGFFVANYVLLKRQKNKNL